MAAQARLEAFRPYVKNNEYIQLDIRDSSIRCAIASLYGGKQVMHESFPYVSQAFDKARQMSPLGVGEPTDFEDGAIITFDAYYPGSSGFMVSGVVSLVHKASVIDQFMEAYTPSGEHFSGGVIRAYNIQHASFPSIFKLPESCMSEPLQIVCVTNYVTAEDGVFHSLLTSTNVSAEFVLNSGISSVTVKAPVKKNAGAALPINICYNRSPLSEEDVDYTYQESFNPATGKQRLWAPLAADVVLDGADSNPFYQIDITTFTLKMDSGKGFAQYIIEGREDKIVNAFTKTDKGFSFNLDEEWKADVPSSRLPARDRIDLYFNVAFQRQNGTLGSLDFSSRRSETSGGNVSIGWLNLLWGCVAKGTLVRMADGSDCLIENLQVGDVIRDTQGPVRIANIIKGVEDYAWAVRTESGLELRCSEGHPILTDQGMVAIEELHGDMKLIDAKGTPQTIVGIWKDSYGGEVYNLVTSREENDEFIANGLVVGGQAAQGQLAKLRESEKDIVDDRLEYERETWRTVVGGEFFEG